MIPFFDNREGNPARWMNQTGTIVSERIVLPTTGLNQGKMVQGKPSGSVGTFGPRPPNFETDLVRASMGSPK